MASIENLEDHCLIAIFLQLSICDLLNISYVCHRWNDLCSKVFPQKHSLAVRGENGGLVNNQLQCHELGFAGIDRFDLVKAADKRSFIVQSLSNLFAGDNQTTSLSILSKKFPNIRQFAYCGNVTQEELKEAFNTWDLTDIRLVANDDFLWSNTFWKNIWLSSLKHLSVIVNCEVGAIEDRPRKLLSQLHELNIGMVSTSHTDMLFETLNLLDDKVCRKIGIGLFLGFREYHKLCECKTTLKILHKVKPWISTRVTRLSYHNVYLRDRDFLNFTLQSYRSLEYLNLSLSYLFKLSYLSHLDNLSTLIIYSMVETEDLTDDNFVESIQNQFDFEQKKHSKLPRFKNLKTLTLTGFIIEPDTKARLFGELFPNIENITLDYPEKYCLHMTELLDSRKRCQICIGKTFSTLAQLDSVQSLIIKIHGQIFYKVEKDDKKRVTDYFMVKLN